VAASVSASAARSASSKRGSSYQAARVSSFSGLTPALAAFAAPALTQALQPLIWLARRCTSSSVCGGTPPEYTALKRCWTPVVTSGRLAMLWMRAVISPPRRSWIIGRHYDVRPRREVTSARVVTSPARDASW
jgi:hypothetical protein